jgi:hypothetical protein
MARILNAGGYISGPQALRRVNGSVYSHSFILAIGLKNHYQATLR